jgi:hypothetical protein
LNFRIDESNKVWFLFCSNVGVIDRDTIARSPAELLAAVGPLPPKKEGGHALTDGRQVSRFYSEDDLSAEQAQPSAAGATSSSAGKPTKDSTSAGAPSSSLFPPIKSSMAVTVPTATTTAGGPTPKGRPQSGSPSTVPLVPLIGSPSTTALTTLGPARTTRVSKHYSYLKETFTDMGWGETAESVKRIVFDYQNFLSPSQR